MISATAMVMWNERKIYRHTHDRDSNFCVCDLNQRCRTTDCIVESFECPLHIVRDVQMLCMFLRSWWIGAIACARKHTQTHTQSCTYTHPHISMDRQRERKGPHCKQDKERKSDRIIEAHTLTAALLVHRALHWLWYTVKLNRTTLRSRPLNAIRLFVPIFVPFNHTIETTLCTFHSTQNTFGMEMCVPSMNVNMFVSRLNVLRQCIVPNSPDFCLF